jgi:mannose-6-phosphate isomerase-like protein (cupin superfamily)
MPLPAKVNLAEKLSLFSEHFQPRIVGEVNEAHVKVVKLQGEFVWHHHEAEDEMFLVLAGRLHIRFREGELALDPGELVIVPRGVEHCPYADEETHVMLFEPKTTVNTGSAGGERTYESTKV